jgi:hypothetical protein
LTVPNTPRFCPEVMTRCGVRRIVAAVSFVDIGTLDRAPGEPLGVFDGGAQRVAIVRIARQRLGVQHELAAGRAGVGGGDRGLDAKLIGRAGLGRRVLGRRYVGCSWAEACVA